jgi:hypothetical protein
MRHIYAKIETNFFHDARFRSMTEGERLAYLAVWLLSVEVGNACLSPEASTSTYLSTRANVHPRSVQSMVKKASTFSQPLLKVREDGGLTVCGITKLHPKVVRFDEGIQEKRREENIRMQKTEKPEPSKDVLPDPLEEPKPEPHNPYRFWQQFKPVLSQSDTSFIAAIWEEFQDVQICEAMKIAADKGKSLGYVRGILAKNKANTNGSRAENANHEAVHISKALEGWSPEEIAAATKLKPQPSKP